MLVARRYNPGGRKRPNIHALATDSTRTHRHPQVKVLIVEEVQQWMTLTGLSLSLAADTFGVSKSCLSLWMKDIDILRKKCDCAGVRLTIHNGPVSQLAPVHDELMSFVDEYRRMGFSVSKKMLMFQASRISDVDSEFRRNMTGARLQAISRWMARNGLVIRAGTHQAQEAPEVTMSAAVDYPQHGLSCCQSDVP
jgi:hypothetical protein